MPAVSKGRGRSLLIGDFKVTYQPQPLHHYQAEQREQYTKQSDIPQQIGSAAGIEQNSRRAEAVDNQCRQYRHPQGVKQVANKRSKLAVHSGKGRRVGCLSESRPLKVARIY